MPITKPNSTQVDEDLIRIKKHLQNIVENEPLIVAVTGHIGQVYEDRAINSGMDAVLGKPPCETSMK